MKKDYRFLFGPVPSRRLGRSLGVDLTPHKTCSLDCVFCQFGRTTHRTLDREEYVPVREVKRELAAWVEEGGRTDCITLSGSGEPTLHSRFGEVLKMIRQETPFPAVLLSNGTLFWMPAVRKAACHADVVKLSLSVWDQSSFERINRPHILSVWDQSSFDQVNRPHPDLQLYRVIEGQHAFREESQATLWITA